MILVTGGAGYIGSHTCLELLASGYEVVVLDNLSNSCVESLQRVKKIVNGKVSFIKGDIRDKVSLRRIFSQYSITAVIHFAGFKAVGESVEQPLRYYDNNVGGTLCLLGVMAEYGCKQLVFSSSATVYGDPSSVPIRENFPVSATNPYGRTKLMVENILRDLAASDSQWSIALLRYFNPVGAHESGLIGEDPNGIPNNLMPYITQVAVGKHDSLCVFGGDYPTFDGTGVRDYIHIVDLAKGHLKALAALELETGVLTINLGTGRGYSVLEVIAAFEKVSGCKIPYRFVERRQGDVAQCYADPSYAKLVLGWQAEYGIERMCQDAWRWQICNPEGYKSA
ncbi:UDP-glucose 4-epimerase [Nitrincola lacisaponensis]|uniref:UDP-glucose 4-epimerase n=1 Tax=Nitrincola lacisaponensis TaxID=267850 RepID=A0A063Y649_9GAMM|nr:UDP-glucose 4-epimerase GalE [Nitrincola lacisaponensis]KDE41144.1 UDP-glucose 4-epimerase [Nitrincola lacisaponensis]